MTDLAWLIDRTAVVETVDRLFIETDRKRWEAVTALFAPSVAFDMTSLAGGEPAVVAREVIVEAWRVGLAPVTAVHHQSSNHVVRLDGDQAECFCYGTATHYRPEGPQVLTTFVGSYDVRLARVPGGWVVTAFRFTKAYVI